jgi:hypothetical protein
MAKAVKSFPKKGLPAKKPVKKAAPKQSVAKKPAPKKPAPKTTTGLKSETGIKYEDKSAGQPELVPIFNSIKKLLLPYEKGSIAIRGGKGGQIILVSNKPVEINGKKRDELWFAAALIQKGYVGFYFMPVFSKPEIKEVFKPELLKCLKGKSCFHIKKADPVIYAQIEEALAKGYLAHKKAGRL